MTACSLTHSPHSTKHANESVRMQAFGAGCKKVGSGHTHQVYALLGAASGGLIIDRLAPVPQQPQMLADAARRLSELGHSLDATLQRREVKIPYSRLINFDTGKMDRTDAVMRSLG